jgi:hypothetical protein
VSEVSFSYSFLQLLNPFFNAYQNFSVDAPVIL